MTPDRNDNAPDELENAVLGDGGNLDTTAFAIISGTTSQFDVALPVAAADDDDDVIDEGDAFEGHAFGDNGADGEGAADDADGHASDVADAAPDADDEVPFEDVTVDDDDEFDASVHDDQDRDAHGDQGNDERIGETTYDAEVVEPDPDDEPHDQHDDRDNDDDAHDSVDAAHDAAEAYDGGVVKSDDDHADADIAPHAVAAVEAVASDPMSESGPIPLSRRAAFHADADQRHDVERIRAPRTAEVTLESRRLGDFEVSRESSDLLTADRLLDPAHVVRPEPEGAWQHFVYTISGRRINLGDGKRARERKELDRRIAGRLSGGARFVPILSRKGGVGKTTVTTLLGMALADARDDRVIAIDANPDRGTLAERIQHTSGKTVRDLVRQRDEVVGYNDLSSIVGRDETRLDVLASDSDPRVSEAFSDRDYYDVASIAAHYYSIVLTDTGTGIVHSVMGATLELADQLIIVAGLSVDEARLASETITWLETNGFAEQVRESIVVLNTARPGAPLVRADELETHFRTRVRSVVRIPYDPHIAAGSAVRFSDLQPATRAAARKLAATLVESLRALSPAA